MWSSDGGDSPMAKRNQVVDRQRSAAQVIGGDHIGVFQAGFAVKIDDGRATLPDGAEQGHISTGRAIDKAGDLTIEEHGQRGFLLLRILIGVTDQDGIAVIFSNILNGFNKSGEKRIANIGDHYADGAGLLSPEPSGFAWLVFSVAMDSGQDSFASTGSNVIGPVKGSGNGGDAHV